MGAGDSGRAQRSCGRLRFEEQRLTLFGRAVRLPGGDVPAVKEDGRSKSAGVAPVRGAVRSAAEKLDGDGPVEAGPAGDPDGWYPHRLT